MNLMIVDDEQALRELVARMLAPLGHTIVQAADAESALVLLEQQTVAVALVDRSLPGRDGDWLIERIRERHRAVALILATADDAIPARISLQDGIVGYLVKPIDGEQLRQAVTDAIAWHRVATKSTVRRPGALEGDEFDTWLRRAGRPEPEGDL